VIALALMTKQYEIHQRIFNFVIRGLKVIKFIPKSIEGKIITDQYVRSITSCGANDNEADGTLTAKDFIHCYIIVRKELKEVYYWLRIISSLYPTLSVRLVSLLEENEQLIKIVSTIIQKSTK
jgi:four helix bundle protein